MNLSPRKMQLKADQMPAGISSNSLLRLHGPVFIPQRLWPALKLPHIVLSDITSPVTGPKEAAPQVLIPEPLNSFLLLAAK